MDKNALNVLNEDYKNLLIDKAYEVEALLNKYIQIHDKRLKTAGTFRSLLGKVNFEEIYKEVDELFWGFEEKRVEIMAMQGDYSEYTKIQQNFYDTLDTYFSALFEAVEMLHLIANKQNELSKGTGEGKLTLQENLDLEKKYQEKIKGYMDLGGKLNEAFDLMKKEEDL